MPYKPKDPLSRSVLGPKGRGGPRKPHKPRTPHARSASVPKPHKPRLPGGMRRSNWINPYFMYDEVKASLDANEFDDALMSVLAGVPITTIYGMRGYQKALYSTRSQVISHKTRSGKFQFVSTAPFTTSVVNGKTVKTYTGTGLHISGYKDVLNESPSVHTLRQLYEAILTLRKKPAGESFPVYLESQGVLAFGESAGVGSDQSVTDWLSSLGVNLDGTGNTGDSLAQQNDWMREKDLLWQGGVDQYLQGNGF